ncbi:MAG TPA: aminopeptidase [Burkholderiales bacterium]|nr:aminopeptidase [Burkholderiales bacterium]
MVIFRRLSASVLAALLLTGCETLSYYAQAIGGQMSLLSQARPVADLLADPATPPPLRERLRLARDIRNYAVKDLKLPDNASYRSYADIGRPYAVWNVVAAPEFSLEPLKSCFPVAGCVSYRGFFSQDDAERYAAGLRAQGNDVYVQGVPAYSTLGHFDDPLLSTFINFPDASLAQLVFHELAHQVAYVQGDSTFNESFAVMVEQEGVRRWLAATGRSAEQKAYLAARERNKAYVSEIEQARARLRVLYRQRIAPEAMRAAKRAEFAALKAKLGGGAGSKDLAPNNAFLAAFATYTDLVSSFEYLLQEEGGDLERFYARVRKYAASAPSDRGPFSAPAK